MIRTRQNVVMPTSIARPGSVEAIHLINYLSTINQYAPAYNSQQNNVVASSFSFHPGMKDVPQWLKSLRLHKYTSIFMDLSYEQMININEDVLEERGVTMGARGKILQSIQKLKRRPYIIREIITQLDASKDPECRCPIILLRQFTSTPIRDYQPLPSETQDKIDGNCNVEQINDNNIPALLVLLLQKVQYFIINCRQGEISDDYILMLFKSHDLILSNEAFTENQKRRVTHLKKQAKKYVCPGRKIPGMLPSGKCDFCTTRDALIGPMPLADVLPQSPTQKPKDKKKSAREPRRNKSRLPELEIGEWNPTAPSPTIPSTKPESFDLSGMAQYLNYVQQQTNIQRDNYRQAMINLAYAQDLANYVAAQQALQQQQVKQQQQQSLSRNSSQWNNTYAAAARDTRMPEPAIPVEARPTPVVVPAAKQTVDLPGISYIPQYRSRAIPTLPSATSSLSQTEKDEVNEPRWPTTLYNNSDLLKMVSTFPPNLKETPAGVWSNPRAKTESGNSTSGYSSSESERGSGAGSPRAPHDVSDSKEEPRAWNTWESYTTLFSDVTRSASTARC